MSTAKPLPPAVASLLRGEIDESGQWTELTALGLESYRAGKAGETFEPVTDPGGLPEAVERVNEFLLACWNQGAGA